MTGSGVSLSTERLVLREWRVAEAAVQRELWLERDPRVPPHRRVDAEGRPTLEELEQRILANPPTRDRGLLALQRRSDGAVLGYCGLLGDVDETGPELAFELLRRHWGQGYATEAATAVVERARESGVERLRATVWDWNTASRRVLAKLGFTEVGPVAPVSAHGTTLLTQLSL